MKLQVARKEHVCAECGKKILPDTKYWRDFDSLYGDTKTHTNCALHETKITATEKEETHAGR